MLAAVEYALPSVQIVVATSIERPDDPLASYLSTLGATVFRGPLDNVFERFRMCVFEHPCDRFLRLNADSPFLDGCVLQA